MLVWLMSLSYLINNGFDLGCLWVLVFLNHSAVWFDFCWMSKICKNTRQPMNRFIALVVNFVVILIMGGNIGRITHPY